ncbi:MAG: host-nuclease inhibitor Gam family protein [Armatimonadota bacterium]|nr:host-nuclease inhibitor Gam family protein [Armatimonadota bacterium]
MPGVKKTDVTVELDRLCLEVAALGRKIRGIEHARNMHVRFYMQRIREESETFEQELAPLKEKRERLRRAILDLWAEHHEGTKTLELPCGKVTRRTDRELVVRDKEALLDALDRADRLDLVDHVFDEKAVAHLIAEGKLPGLPGGAAQVVDHYSIAVQLKKGDRRA